jgi:hypothetical protein
MMPPVATRPGALTANWLAVRVREARSVSATGGIADDVGRDDDLAVGERPLLALGLGLGLRSGAERHVNAGSPARELHASEVTFLQVNKIRRLSGPLSLPDTRRHGMPAP